MWKHNLLLFSSLFLLILALYFIFFQPPFPGVASLGAGGFFTNRCNQAAKELNSLTQTNGFVVGRLLDTNYLANRIYLKIESLEGKKYSLMIFPTELSTAMGTDFYHLGYNLFRLRYYPFSFCGHPNTFSTTIYEGNNILDGTYPNIRDLLERYQGKGKLVQALILNDRNSFIFDRSGTILIDTLSIESQ